MLRPGVVLRAAGTAAALAPTVAAPIAARLATFFTVRLRAVARPPFAAAARRFGLDPARFLLELRFAGALRRGDEAARFLEDFFDDRERFAEDFVERFLEEDRLLDAMGFL